MKLFDYLDRCITDDQFRVVFMDGNVNIINYIEVLDFTSKEVSIEYDKGIVMIKGEDLVVSKMLDDELLIRGRVASISYNGK